MPSHVVVPPPAPPQRPHRAYLLLIVAATYLLNAYDEDSWGVAVGTIGLLGC